MCCTLCFLLLMLLLLSQVEDWRAHAGRFLAVCDDVAILHSAVVNSINRAVLYDLYPYIWDLRNTLLVAKAFICWLGERDTVEWMIKKRGSSLFKYFECESPLEFCPVDRPFPPVSHPRLPSLHKHISFHRGPYSE